MPANHHTARYLVESGHCAVVRRDDGAYLLGYFRAPRREWTYMATFDQEASARRAFRVFNRNSRFYKQASTVAVNA